MKRTPIYDVYSHYEGVKLIDFGGWELPVNYSSGILAEHEAVRTKVGLFDVSHMGECLVTGETATDFLDYLCTNAIRGMQKGEVMYTMMCYPNGTVVDDLLIYCRDRTSYLVVMNASNIEKDLAWMQDGVPFPGKERPTIVDLSDRTVLLALQGPLAVQVLTKLIPECSDMPSFTYRSPCAVGEVMSLISRTGYTGEDGFELYCASEDGKLLWNTLLEAGVEEGIIPCGLGCRDTLRLEAKLPLYGHEISDSITPLEANLGVFVRLEKEDFCGRDALAKQKDEGVPRTLRGVEMVDKAVPRSGCEVFLDDELIGFVTSGTKSPTLDIFCAYVLIRRDIKLKFGDEVTIEIHGKRKRAKLVKTPFYKHGKRYDEER
ncbi:glycine cleavage system aminomethyltransferase GcvT [Sphaerochaeta sp. PS]|uniref:glycine cleavage system aminomethyltransferase GcvT n=1 Tax=Sphaerochaeta sp. PS TaxID=3076336 RepID=UPI0028A493A5|nr:glycine cleavage system aminomethyltransferase GcvT [Sphaerochaeta sp. PS]MDT4762329.1 glycine cleavage system aminomethyltransferase GcvT [Sphaerochaeta sp. PS]